MWNIHQFQGYSGYSYNNWLVVWKMFHFPLQLGISSSKLTNSYFFRGVGIPPTRESYKCDHIWFIRESPIKMNDLGVPPCMETLHIYIYRGIPQLPMLDDTAGWPHRIAQVSELEILRWQGLRLWAEASHGAAVMRGSTFHHAAPVWAQKVCWLRLFKWILQL